MSNFPVAPPYGVGSGVIVGVSDGVGVKVGVCVDVDVGVRVGVSVGDVVEVGVKTFMPPQPDANMPTSRKQIDMHFRIVFIASSNLRWNIQPAW